MWRKLVALLSSDSSNYSLPQHEDSLGLTFTSDLVESLPPIIIFSKTRQMSSLQVNKDSLPALAITSGELSENYVEDLSPPKKNRSKKYSFRLPWKKKHHSSHSSTTSVSSEATSGYNSSGSR